MNCNASSSLSRLRDVFADADHADASGVALGSESDELDNVVEDQPQAIDDLLAGLVSAFSFSSVVHRCHHPHEHASSKEEEARSSGLPPYF